MEEKIIARCMKCKGPKEMVNAKDFTMKTGMKAKKGECKICGTKMFRIIGMGGPTVKCKNCGNVQKVIKIKGRKTTVKCTKCGK